jgi:hypothetical protein
VRGGMDEDREEERAKGQTDKELGMGREIF